MGCVKSMEVTECMTPTTCPSENGEEDLAALSEESLEDQIMSSFHCAARWADICDLESECPSQLCSPRNEQAREESGKKVKAWRRSGRARQREQRRRRLRTPSPVRDVFMPCPQFGSFFQV